MDPKQSFKESNLGILDLVRAAIATCVKPPAPRTTPLLAGMDIGILIKQEQRSYWISNWAADSLLMETLVRRWSDSGFSFSQIIYIYENQPWERALCWAARRRFPEATLVGYQHAGVPGLLMNFFFIKIITLFKIFTHCNHAFSGRHCPFSSSIG